MTRVAPPPVYQVDFSAAGCGKRIGMTKRRIRWRFGFANPRALSEGACGVDCRGDEHEVVVVWSVTSGKRQIIMDGQEVHHSVAPNGKMQGRFEYSFDFRARHVLQIVVHAAPPMGSGASAANGGAPIQRQFDMFLDGESYFTFPKIFELGVHVTSRGAPRSNAAALISPAYANYALEDDQAYMPRGGDEYRTASQSGSPSYRRQISRDAPPPNYVDTQSHCPSFAQGPAPTQDYHHDQRESAPSPPALVTPTASDSNITSGSMEQSEPELLDLVSDALTEAPGAVNQGFTSPPTAPAPAPYQEPLQQPTQQWEQPQAPMPTPAPVQQWDQQPSAPYYPPQTNTAAPPSYQGDYYAQDVNQVQPQPMGHYQFQQVSHDIMTKYNETPQLTNEASTEETAIVPVSPDRSVTKLTMEPVDPYQEQREEEDDVDELSKAMKNLVNFNDISQEPEAELKLTLSQKKEEPNVVKDRKGKIVRSKGIAPPAEQWIGGAQPTLGQMQHVRPQPKGDKEVMKAPPSSSFHPSAVQAGSLVVYGGAGGPPPLDAAGSGFGVGAHYAQQQQQHHYHQQQYHQQAWTGPPGHAIRS